MNWRDVWPSAWLLNLEWICDVHNLTAQKILGWRTPIEVLTGQTPDISILTCFLFWDVVYCARHKDKDFKNLLGSEKSNEIRGYFVGFAWNVGHALTFKILTCDTHKIIYRSVVRLANDAHNNLKLDKQAKPEREFIRSAREDGEVLPTIDISSGPILAREALPPIVKDTDDTPSPLDSDEPVGPVTTPQEDRDAIDLSSEKGESPSTNHTPSPITSEIGESPSTDPSPSPSPPEKGESRPNDPSSYWEPKASKRARKPTTRYGYNVETVEEEVESYRSPMDSPPLRDEPDQPIESMFHDPEDRPEQLDPTNKPGREKKEDNEAPLDFSTDPLETPNPTVRELTADDLVGRSFLMPPKEDGSRYRAKIVEKMNYMRAQGKDEPELIKFKCRINNEYNEIVAYNDVVDYIEKDDGWDGIWMFEEILDHQGPLRPGDPRYMGSKYNVLVRWTDGSITWEPLNQTDENGKRCGIIDSDPVTVAIYARKHNLLDTPGWKSSNLRRLAKTHKRIERQAKKAKLHSFRMKPIYMYGFLVPRNWAQAMRFDEDNGNDKWAKSVEVELGQVDEYETFLDKGVGYKPGPEYKKINVHLVFAVKHDGRHKARLVAGGHLTDTPIDSVYSSVISLRGIRMLTFIAELNDLDLWCTDIGNTYLESYTQEKVYIIAGDEFGDRKGHTLIIQKALYGLKSSGLRWHERLVEVLREMGFQMSKTEPDIWMRDKGDHYEYIAVYIDDLTIASKSPQEIIYDLTKVHHFKLKGTGPILFLLGCDFFRDEDGMLCYAPRKYIEKMVDNYHRHFGQNPKKAQSPLTKGDHPELDTSELLDSEDIQVYQSLIGALQWVIQIGRWDVSTAVMTLSRFRVAPRQGHMERVKRIHGYLMKFKHGVIRIDTSEPDHSGIPETVYDWEHSCYGGAREEIPDDIPPPKGKPVVTTTYVDANLLHDLISGRSVTGIIHFFNNTVVDTFSKLQPTVETATFGSEFVATRTAVDQIVANRIALRYLGVPVKGPSFLFGDNESVVTNSTIPHSKLGRRHTALAYHRTRAAIAAGILRYHHVDGDKNPADILSKHWDNPSIWKILRPLMFYYKEDQQPQSKGSHQDGVKPSVTDGRDDDPKTSGTADHSPADPINMPQGSS